MSDAGEFFAVVQAGDAKRVGELLDGDPGLVRARGEKGESPILVAVYYGRRAVLDLLLSRGAQLDIFEAAAAGRSDRITQLVTKDGKLVNSYASDGFTPLGLAAFFGHREVVDLLLRHGADVNAVSQNATGYTALTGAVAGGHAEIVALLLGARANPNHRYGPGYTPLLEAAGSGKSEIARHLLEGGADPNARTDDGQTPLAVAEAKGHSAVAALLRQYGAKA